MSWTDQNELMRIGKKMLDATGTSTPSEKSMIATLASSTGVAYNVARDAYVKSVLDPLLQDKVRKSMKWLIHANFTPEFVDGEAPNTDLDDSIEALDPATINPDGLSIPKRMFNIDTGNLEDWPSGQYVILSHSWKGQEITYPFITSIKESRKMREAYEMVEDDSDDEARKFGRFQAKKFKHLEAGKSDIELLNAQCTQDIKTQVKKIETVLKRAGIQSSPGELLVHLAELKEASWTASGARNSFNAKRKELEQRKIADKALEKDKEDAGLEDLEMPILDEKDTLKNELNSAEEGLLKAEEWLHKAESRLKQATQNCESMNRNPMLRSAVEDLLPVLERKKSMNKIEGSMREAKRILDSGLFPSNGQRRYLWNDTVCINKGDANELTESLAMMGQWYNNADFCLVHLDTPSPTEWVDTWNHLETPAEAPNFKSFDDIVTPKWSTRGWTLQELVLSKMTYYVNNLWKPLTRGVEGLGPYYYHCSYLNQHIRDRDIFNVPPEAKDILSDIAKLRALMDSGEKIDYIDYPGCSEKSRRLIGILEYLGVHFPGEMDDNNSSAYIRNTISLAAYSIESRLAGGTSTAKRTEALFTDLGFDLNSTRAQARNLIKLVIRALVKDCVNDIKKDRERVAEFTNVPPSECCRGLSKSSHSAHDIMALAAYRECTVAIDRVYSLMGVLSVKFAAFHAEGPTQALCRLLDEVVITTNDVSIFNWAGKDLGSPIRGRSLYPSALAAFSPEMVEGFFNSRRNDVLARASKEKRYGLQNTAKHLTLLLRRTITFVKSKSSSHEDIPIDLIKTILEFIRETSLHDLRPQVPNLGKLLVYLEDTPKYEEYRRSTHSGHEGRHIGNESKKAQSSGNLASRFGIKAPQMPSMPQMPQMPQVSAPKFKVGGFGGFGKKTAPPKEPEPVITPIVAPPPPAPVVEEHEEEPETLAEEIDDWISTKKDIKNVPEDFQDLFEHLQTPNLDEVPAEKKKQQVDETSPSKSNICPNPIMLTTSGIAGVFDIQRVIISMENAEGLRYQVQNAVSDSQKISGHCTISTALSTISVNFSCAAGILGKELDVCDVVERALFEVKPEKAAVDAAQSATTPGQENTSYYSKLTSYGSGFIGKGTNPEDIKKEEAKAAAAAEEADQAFGETEDQRRVCRMLDFVQETNINLIVGEWVLARFTGAEGAKWFLCQIELGSTHSFYGRRIATDDIDFKNVVPESGLVGHWENYMRNKKTELCRIVTVLIHGRVAKKYADEVTTSADSKNGGGDDDDSDDGAPSKRQKLLEFIVKRGTLLGADMVQTLTDMWGERLDGMLSDTILQQVPKGLRAAIMNLNENEDLLPAMFLSGVKVHMF